MWLMMMIWNSRAEKRLTVDSYSTNLSFLRVTLLTLVPSVIVQVLGNNEQFLNRRMIRVIWCYSAVMRGQLSSPRQCNELFGPMWHLILRTVHTHTRAARPIERTICASAKLWTFYKLRLVVLEKSWYKLLRWISFEMVFRKLHLNIKLKSVTFHTHSCSLEFFGYCWLAV